MAGQREGIAAQFTARTATAPRARFYPSGELVWEFNVRVVDTWDAAGRVETVTVRAPDQNYGSLQNWVKPGAQLFLRGWLTVARFKSAVDGKDKARLVIDCIELMPMQAHVQGSAPGAMDYTGRVTAPSSPPADEVPKMTQAEVIRGVSKKSKESPRDERIALARRMMEEAGP